MRIVLLAVNGSYTHTNLAIRALRRPLERDGFEVVLLEKNLRDRMDHVLRELAALSPEIVGFSTYIWNLPQMLTLASNLRKILPECRIIFGGPEVSYETERFQTCSFIDAIICGEGEIALPGLCRDMREHRPYERIIQGELDTQVMRDEGILYREEDLPQGSIVYYESSRGCPFSCSYCLSSVAEGMRCKTVEQTLKDLEAFEAFPDQIRIIKFVDRTFNAPMDRANQIWQALLEERFTKHYHFEVCASLLNEEAFKILEQFPAGKIQLEFGLQSTYEPTLAAVARHTDPHQVLQAVDRIHRMGTIHVHLDLIAGLPYEDYKRFARSFDEAYGTCDMLQLGFLKLLPGTSLREKAREYGIVYTEEPPYTVLKTKWMSYEELGRLADIADLLERFHHSGNFKRCLPLAIGDGSPFAFYEGLSEYIAQNDGRQIRQIGQNDAYRLLYDYVCKKQAKEQASAFSGEQAKAFSGEQAKAFSREMHEDYAASQTRRMPGFLQNL